MKQTSIPSVSSDQISSILNRKKEIAVVVFSKTDMHTETFKSLFETLDPFQGQVKA